MRKIVIRLLIAIPIVLLQMLQTSVHAQASRTWVSGIGDDVNPCSRTAPCKTFAGAYAKTAAGGEISVLDPGGFGTVTITKSLTISGDGTLASILASGANAININAPNSFVTIRNLSIIYVPPTVTSTNNYSGINYLNAKQVNIENCTFDNFLNGINGNLTTAAGALMVENTIITHCATGINLTSSANSLTACIDNVHLLDTTGILASSNVIATISNSTISQGITAVQAQNNGIVNVESCIVSNNTTGINSKDATSTVRLSNVSIFDNTTGITGAGKVVTFSDNKLAGNGTNSTQPLSVLKAQ